MADETKALSAQVVTDKKPARDERGRLLPGGTANPRGLRHRIPDDVHDYLEHNTLKAARRLVEGLDAIKHIQSPTGMAEVPDMKERRESAMSIFERLYGRPPQSITDQNGNPFAGAIILLPAETKE